MRIVMPASSDLQVTGPVSERARAFASSELFQRTFREGMGLVEETATYLDGVGRTESRDLPRRAALAYAGESMRLTTRLMQVASWLLVQRALANGEMSPGEAANEKYRLGAKEVCRGRRLEAAELLPARLVSLLERSEQLYERIDRLDQSIYVDEPAAAGMHGARAQLSALEAMLANPR